MTWRLFHPRNFLFAMSIVAAVFVFSRCSPVATSMQKNGLNALPGGGVGSGAIPSTVKVFRYKTRVLTGEDYSDTLRTQPSGAHKVTLTDSQVSEFIEHGKIVIELPGAPIPDVGQGFFEVTLSSPEIENQELAKFDTDLKPKDGTSWTLSIPASVPAEVKRSLLDRLVNVTLTVATD